MAAVKIKNMVLKYMAFILMYNGTARINDAGGKQTK